MIYKLQKDFSSDAIVAVTIIGQAISIPFDVDNTDYQKFKAEINDESAQLEDADGVLMSPEAAKAYVATLP
jgi:2-keto-4-pentenoate hydratase